MIHDAEQDLAMTTEAACNLCSWHVACTGSQSAGTQPCRATLFSRAAPVPAAMAGWVQAFVSGMLLVLAKEEQEWEKID